VENILVHYTLFVTRLSTERDVTYYWRPVKNSQICSGVYFLLQQIMFRKVRPYRSIYYILIRKTDTKTVNSVLLWGTQWWNGVGQNDVLQSSVSVPDSMNPDTNPDFR
jgi:hypothetical protein